ncbi:MAG: hypothetical protein Q9219_004368 [cf. Caloplaca sp. 3 TL-2023]
MKRSQIVFGVQAPAGSVTVLLRKSSSPPLELFDNELERRSFTFFNVRTAPEISGYFPSDFWCRLVPLATYHEPALKHAVIALAAIHERFEKGDQTILKSNNDIAEGGFALQQYNKAICYLIRPRGTSARPGLDTSWLILPVLLQMIGTRPMSLPVVKSNTEPGFSPGIPAVFKSLEEARNNLDYNYILCVQKAIDFEHRDLILQGKESEEHRASYDGDRLYFRDRYRRWSTAFQAFLDANVAQMDSKTLQGAMVLKLTAHVAGMHLDVCAFQVLHFQTMWDKLLPLCQELIDIAAVVIDAHKVTDGQSSIKPIFQMDHSFVGPLFTVAHRCRDPFLRRKAIALLYKVPRQEGVWNSHLTARVAERLVHIEEEGLGKVKCASDVPDWRRISDVDVSFDLQQKRGTIKYSRLRSLYSTVREPVTDIVEW